LRASACTTYRDNLKILPGWARVIASVFATENEIASSFAPESGSRGARDAPVGLRGALFIAEQRLRFSRAPVFDRFSRLGSEELQNA
jgi:hypothetical protein